MMKSMEQIHRVKELQMQQQGPYQIAKELKMDVKTVRKYMAKEDFSPVSVKYSPHFISLQSMRK